MSSDPPQKKVDQLGASDKSVLEAHNQLQKKKLEKNVGYDPFPLLLLGIMCCAIFFGSIYLAHYSGHFDPSIYNEHQEPATGPVAAATVTPVQLGKRTFSQVCIICHQAMGQGVPGIYPPLAHSEWAQGSEERIISIVLHGLTGHIKVDGKEFNNTMAPFGAALKDDQIANALTYVRQEWGNKAPPVDSATVAKVRTETAGRTKPWTVDELEKIGNP